LSWQARGHGMIYTLRLYSMQAKNHLFRGCLCDFRKLRVDQGELDELTEWKRGEKPSVSSSHLQNH